MASNPRLLNFAWQICVDDKTGQVPLHEFIKKPARTACESRFASNSRRTICFESQRPVSTPCRWGSTMGTDRPSPRCRKTSALSVLVLRRRGISAHRYSGASTFRHGRASSRPSTSFLPKSSKVVDARSH